MVRALICSEDDLGDELADTVLGRDGVVRHVARRIEDARTLALAARPAIVMVDRDLPQADQLVAALREDSITRGLSIAVVARGDFDAAELELLDAGANAILRLPAGPEWDSRLNRLLSVPPRKQARFPVNFWVVASCPDLSGAAAATGLNLSLTGMLLETSVKGLDLNAELDFDIRLPGGDTLAGCGRVVRLAGLGQYGVEFAALSADAADAVLRFVETAGGH